MGMVIAYKDIDRVLFASDTQRTSGGLRYHGMVLGAGMNINHFENGITVAFSGSVCIKETLTFHPEWFDEVGEEPLTKRFLLQSIVPKLYDEICKRNLLEENSVKHGRSKMNGTFLVAKGTDLFYIDSDFAVITVGRYAIIGENSNFALASADLLLGETKDKKEIMLMALKDVQKRSNTVSAPYYFTDTKDREFLFEEDRK